MILASLVSSLADDAFASESEVDFIADELPFESCLASVPLFDDCEAIHVAGQSGLDFSTIHGGDILLDARDEKDVRGFDGGLGIHSDSVAFLEFISISALSALDYSPLFIT